MTGTRAEARLRATERARAALEAHGQNNVTIRAFDAPTATATDAAAAIGTQVGRIVKSLVFMADDAALVVLASGANRVDLEKLKAHVGVDVRRANADEVRQSTGFAIGGVPPVGHTAPLRTLVDPTLLRFDEVWAAAGTHNSLFAISPTTLVELTRGEVADIAHTTK